MSRVPLLYLIIIFFLFVCLGILLYFICICMRPDNGKQEMSPLMLRLTRLTSWDILLAQKRCIILLYLLLSFIFWHCIDTYPLCRQTHAHTHTHAHIKHSRTCACELNNLPFIAGILWIFCSATLGIIKTHCCPKINWMCSLRNRATK